ncbi:MAG: hypothetical protein KF745_05505 [Phycisphaeraceae bacterium]|nr:hypothetical protein [Phycisphaeraceae bacterium]
MRRSDRMKRAGGAVAMLVGMVLGVVAGGCTPSRTYVLEPTVVAHHEYTTAALKRLEPTVAVDAEVQGGFEERLADSLDREARVKPTPDGELVVEYRFVHYEEGNVALRVGSGMANLFGSPFYGLGDGTLGIEVRFVDAGGQPLGKILVDGPIVGAFGSASEGAAIAAESVAQYAKVTFGPAAPAERRDRSFSFDRAGADKGAGGDLGALVE